MKTAMLTVFADDLTQFYFLPPPQERAEVNTSHFGNTAETDKALPSYVSKCTSLCDSKRNFRAATILVMDKIRKFSLAPAHDNWELLRAEYPNRHKEMFDCLRSIATILNDHLCIRDKVDIPTTMEHYSQAFSAALLALKPIRQVENIFYKLYDSKYDIHFDPITFEFIISKSPGKGFLGFLKRHSGCGYKLRHRKWALIFVGSFNIG